MGQKVHPYSFRLPFIRTWHSRWFSDKNYAELLHEDIKIRKLIEKKIEDGGISKIEIERLTKDVIVTIHTSRPGVIIGRQGAGISDLADLLRKEIQKPIDVKIQEVKRADLDATILATNIAKALEHRIPYRRAAKQALQRAVDAGAKGVKIIIAGRLNNAEIARKELFLEGSVPLHTLRADIDYASTKGITNVGAIGVKVWICTGEVFNWDTSKKQEEQLRPRKDTKVSFNEIRRPRDKMARSK